MTLFDRILTGVGAVVFGALAGVLFAALWFAIPVGAAPPPPSPSLTLTKTAFAASVDLYDDVEFTITIFNAGNAPSGYLELTDTLQGVALVDAWELEDDTFSAGCDITDNVLTCAGIVPKRTYLDKEHFPEIFYDGRATVTIVALAMKCGTIENVARVNHEYEEETTRLRTNVARVTIRGCETPTPSPTATPFATSTLIPSTPTLAPTATATVASATTVPTATPFRVAPLPPNTGSGQNVADSERSPLFAQTLSILGAFLGLTTIGYKLIRR